MITIQQLVEDVPDSEQDAIVKALGATTELEADAFQQLACRFSGDADLAADLTQLQEAAALRGRYLVLLASIVVNSYGSMMVFPAEVNEGVEGWLLAKTAGPTNTVPAVPPSFEEAKNETSSHLRQSLDRRAGRARLFAAKSA